MKIRVPILVCLLFVCLRGYGAPSLSVSGNSMTVTVPPGHSVAWMAHEQLIRSGIAADADNDGQVVIPISQHAVGLVAVDISTGEWVYGSAVGRAMPQGSFPPASIVRGPNGAFSQLILPSFEAFTALWVRPGVGAWVPRNASLTDADGASNDLIFYEVTSMVPLGASPATPSGFAHGDRLLTLNIYNTSWAGIVDPFLDAPPSGGTLSFIHSGSSVVEGASKPVRLMRVGGAEGTVTVRCTTAPDTGEAGVDFTPMDQVFSFAPGEIFKTIDAATVNDATYAVRRKDFQLTLSNPSGAALGSETVHTISISDNDPRPRIAFADVPASVAERDAPWTLPIPIVVSNPFRDPLAVTFQEQAAVTTELTFQPGEMRKEVLLPIAGNDLPNGEVGRSFSARSELGDYASGSLVVVDDDPVELRIQDPTVVEAAEAVEIPVHVDLPVYASFSWATVDGTAKAGEDFFGTSGHVSLSGTASLIYIPLRRDEAVESTETFYIDITALSGPITSARTRITVTIGDDDAPAPAITVDAVSVAEGHFGLRHAQVPVRLATPPSSYVILQVSTRDGTASRGSSDYGVLSETVTFAPSEQVKFVRVPIYGDTTDEQDETVEVAVFEKTVFRAVGTITIVDDDLDTSSASGVSDTTVEEQTGSPAYAVFRVTLSPPPPAEARIDYATEDVTAFAGADYVAAHGTLTFAAGQTSQEVRVEVLGDSAIEPAETFALRLLNPAGTRIEDDRALATIFDDDDPAPAVTIAPVSVIEGHSGVTQAALKVTLAQSVTHTVRLNVASTGGGSATANDYQALSEALVFAPGQAELTVSLGIIGDTVDENDETVEVAVRDGTTVLATANVTIVDDDTPISITIADVTVQEKTGPSSTAAFRVTMAPAPVTYATFEVATVDGTATAGADYLPISGTVIFFAGQAQGDIEVEVFGDSQDEPNEAFTLRITNAVGANIVDDRATATIVDDDDSAPAAVSIAPVSLTEGNSGQQQLDLHVRLGAPLTAPLTLSIASNPGSAASSVDYLPVSRSITFAPGQTDIVVQATIVGDVVDENHENFFVTASEGTTLRATGVVTILDDDSASTAAGISVADIEVREGDGMTEATFTLTLSRAMTAPVTASYSTFEHTASPPRDYEEKSGSVTFAPGETSRPVTVRIAGDREAEPREMFRLRLLSSEGAPIDDGTALCTIVDDDTLTKRRTSRH